MGCLPIRSHDSQNSVLALAEMISGSRNRSGYLFEVGDRLTETAEYGISKKKKHTYSLYVVRME